MRQDNIRAESKTVSATHFVRHFSELRRNAERGPVYIENHGKPGWALLSSGLLDAMARGAGGDDAAGDGYRQLDALMDALVTRVMLVDTDLRLIRANPAARRHYDIGDESLGVSLDRIMSPAMAQQTISAARRTLDSGTSEIMEADSTRYPGRAMRITTARVSRGVAVVVEDLGDPSALRMFEQRASALETALGVLPGGGFGSINARGAIDRTDPSLCTISGVGAAQVIGTQLGTLFDVRTRTAVNDLIEHAIGHGQAGSADACLLANGETRCPITIGMAPVGGRSIGAGATFVIISRAQSGSA